MISGFVGSSSARPNLNVQSPLHSLTFRAMGSEMNLWLAHPRAEVADAHLALARVRIESAEASLSRFQPSSELCQLNASPDREVAVSRLLWEAVRRAIDGSQRTEGLYDPTVIDALETAGYDRSFPDLHSTHRDAKGEARPSTCGWRRIRLDHRRRRVSLPRGVRLDLGGIAKAWIAEVTADYLSSLGPCLVDAGGDIAVRACPPGEPGWTVGIADPRAPDTDLTMLTITAAGVATSGVDYRRWNYGNIPQHHVIDPRTGRPAATDLLTATVVAARADEANVHAIAALVQGTTSGLGYLERQRGVEGLLVHQNGQILTTRGFARLEHRGR